MGVGRLGRQLRYSERRRTGVQRGDSALRATIQSITSPIELIDYLDAKQMLGHYPVWVRYICYLRLSRLATAMEYMDGSKRVRLHHTQLAQLVEIEQFVATSDTAGVSGIRQSWSHLSEPFLGPLDQTFERF